MACLAPELRFEGYTDAWEQRKFSELATLRRGLTYTPADIRPYGKGVRVLRSSNIDEDRFVLSDDDVFVDESVVGIDLAQDGEILITAANGSPRLVGKRAVIGGLSGKTVHGGFMLCARAECPDFVSALMGSRWYRCFLATGVAGGNGSIGNLDKSALENEDALVPGDEEQGRIGALFSSLDNLITLHQRERDKLVTTKQSLLQKMFPKPGETVPEVRFEGFEEAWRQFKLGELLFFQNGFNGSSDSFGCGTPLISVMDVLGDGFITHDTIRGQAKLSNDEMKRFAVEYGDVLFQRSSENFEDAGTSNVYLDESVPAAFGGFVIRGKKNADYDPVFIKYLLATSAVRRQITSRAQGAQHINVSQNTLADVDVRMPSMEEQKAIGATMKNMDDFISLRQDELKMLKQLKSALLQKMFV